MEKVFGTCVVLLAVASLSAAVDLQSALKMAQCRANCFDKFEKDATRQDDASCHQDPNCFMCWDNCENLATNYPIWSITCGQRDICGEGCEAACEFFSSHASPVVPLVQRNSRLTLVFSGTAAQWTLTWGRESPREHVVYVLFTRRPGDAWQMRLQTANMGTSLEDLPAGSDMKLVAVAESGVLSVIITPYAPPAHPRATVKPAVVTTDPLERPETNIIEDEPASLWPLLHEAEVEESGLVAARVWWAPQTPNGGDYLVTWEVEGGGLKGHLYTDLPEVDLTLWPETIYHVQVELVTGPLGDPHRSAVLTLDTHNITLQLQAQTRLQNAITPRLPLVHQFATPAHLELALGVGAGVLAALLVVVVIVWKRRQAQNITYDTASTSSTAKWGAWNRTLSDLTLDESLVVKGHKFADPAPTHSTPSRSYNPPPVFTLAPGPSNTLLTLTRPAHTRVNLYSVVPPMHEYHHAQGQVSRI